jgi:hypothetical protein
LKTSEFNVYADRNWVEHGEQALKIALGTFTRSGIEAQVGPDVPAAIQAALSHYAGKIKSGRPPLAIPSFATGVTPPEPKVAFDLTVDAETEELLEQEAARQGTSLGRLATHSVLVYLAELDFLAVPPRAGASGPHMH